MAQRKCYGSQSKKAVIPEDTAAERIWRWEVQLMDLLPADKVTRKRKGKKNCRAFSVGYELWGRSVAAALACRMGEMRLNTCLFAGDGERGQQGCLLQQ